MTDPMVNKMEWAEPHAWFHHVAQTVEEGAFDSAYRLIWGGLAQRWRIGQIDVFLGMAPLYDGTAWLFDD